MPVFTFQKADTVEETIDELLQRLAWITSRLDSKNVKRLDTNETVIKSADGTTEIQGPLLLQKDSAGTLRLKQGYDRASGEFVFNMYDDTGAQTIYLNSSGEAVFAGNVQTLKDAYVGKNIYLGDTETLEAKSIQFYNSGSDFTSITMDTEGSLDITANKDVNISSFRDFSVTSQGVSTINGYDAFELTTTNVSSTTPSTLQHRGSGALNIHHKGSGDIVLETQALAGTLYLNTTTNADVVLTQYSYINSVTSDNQLATKGYVNDQLSLYATESYVDSAISTAISDHVSAYHSGP